MKDAGARERLDQLEVVLRDLPTLVAEAVVAATRPTIDRMTELAAALDRTLAQVKSAVVKAEGTSELLEIVEDDLSALRTDVTTLRATLTATGEKVDGIMSTFARVGRGA